MGSSAIIGKGLYRSRQFFVALLGSVSKEEMAEARQVLGPRLYPVFAALPVQYRRHALTVYRRVRESGNDDNAVWQAALLHDSGKYDPASGRYVTIVHRVLVVLLEFAAPGRRLLRRLGTAPWRGSTRGLRALALYPFYLSEHHAELGAQIALQRGAAPDVAALVAGHHSHRAQSAALLALQSADDRS